MAAEAGAEEADPPSDLGEATVARGSGDQALLRGGMFPRSATGTIPIRSTDPIIPITGAFLQGAICHFQDPTLHPTPLPTPIPIPTHSQTSPWHPAPRCTRPEATWFASPPGPHAFADAGGNLEISKKEC